MKDFNVNAFDLFDKQWALVTAGSMEDFNTMTISWGGVGTIWNKPVATVYVKPIRYTYNYLEKSEYFTVSFYSAEYRKDLSILGSKSGRDTDKIALTKLTAKEVANSVTFDQAEVTLLCKKIYWQDLVTDNMPRDAIDKYYLSEEPHRMYIGEVVDIIK